MTQKINEKKLEKIVAEASTLALERLNFISESKGKKEITEEKINEAVKESLKMVLNEVGETPEGQKKLGALHAKRKKQAFDAFRKDDPEKKHDYMEKSTNAYTYARDKRDKSDSDKNEMDKAFRHGERIGERKKTV